MDINSHRARKTRAFETGGPMGQTTWFKEYISTHYQQLCDVRTAFCGERAVQECSHPKGRHESKPFHFLSTSLQKLITVLSAFRKQQTLQADVHLNQGLLEVSFRERQAEVGWQAECGEPISWDVRFPELRADSRTTLQTQNTHTHTSVCTCLCTSAVLLTLIVSFHHFQIYTHKSPVVHIFFREAEPWNEKRGCASSNVSVSLHVNELCAPLFLFFFSLFSGFAVSDLTSFHSAELSRNATTLPIKQQH